MKEVITARVSKELLEKIEKIANEAMISKSNLVMRILETALMGKEDILSLYYKEKEE